jgi:hypothetical protein
MQVADALHADPSVDTAGPPETPTGSKSLSAMRLTGNMGRHVFGQSGAITFIPLSPLSIMASRGRHRTSLCDSGMALQHVMRTRTLEERLRWGRWRPMFEVDVHQQRIFGERKVGPNQVFG